MIRRLIKDVAAAAAGEGSVRLTLLSYAIELVKLTPLEMMKILGTNLAHRGVCECQMHDAFLIFLDEMVNGWEEARGRSARVRAATECKPEPSERVKSEDKALN